MSKKSRMPSSVGTTRKGAKKREAPKKLTHFDLFANNLEEQQNHEKEQKKEEEFKELTKIFNKASNIKNEGNNYRDDNYLSRLETELERLKKEKRLTPLQLEELETLFDAAIKARNARRRKENGGFEHREPGRYTEKENSKNKKYNGGGKRTRRRRRARSRRSTRKH